MWKAQAGHRVEAEEKAADDDWETDPDFVVRGVWEALTEGSMAEIVLFFISSFVLFASFAVAQ